MQDVSDDAPAKPKAFTKEDKRLILEKQLVIECAIGFAMGRSVFTASIVRMIVPLPDVDTTARGMLLLCDLVDGGDLEEAMGKDYRGKLYSEEGAKWPLASVMLQIYLGFKHMHERGILHQARISLVHHLSMFDGLDRAGFQTGKPHAAQRRHGENHGFR